MSIKNKRIIFAQILLFFPYITEAQNKHTFAKPSKSCVSLYSPHQEELEFEPTNTLNFLEARAMVRQINFKLIEDFWAWTRSDKRPSNFPRDPDFYYATQWEVNGGVKDFLGMTRKPHAHLKDFMERLIQKYGSIEKAKEYIEHTLVKYEVNHRNSSYKMKAYTELNHFPHFSSIQKAYPELIMRVQQRIGGKKYVHFSQFMEQKIKELGEVKQVEEYIINLFVKLGVTFRNFKQKRQVHPELGDVPSFSLLVRNAPHITWEIQKRQNKVKLITVKTFISQLLSKLSRAQAREYIIKTIIKYNITYHNIKQKRQVHPELEEFPDLISLYRYDPSIIEEVLKRQGKKHRVSVKQFMEKLIKEKGGEQKAKKYIIEMLEKHNITYSNATQKILEIPELNGFPHISILKKHYPELIEELYAIRAKNK